jgi:hypothetical protein
MQVMQLIKTAEGGGGCALIPSTATTGSCIDPACAMGQWTPLAIGVLVAIIEAAPDAGGSQKATVSLKSSQVKSIKVRYFVSCYFLSR